MFSIAPRTGSACGLLDVAVFAYGTLDMPDGQALMTPSLGRQLGMSRDNSLIVISYIFHGSSVGLYQNVLPIFVETLGARPEQVGQLVALQAASSVLAIFVSSFMVGRFSYRKQLIVAWVLDAVSGAIFVFAPSWHVVAIGMALSGMVNFVIPACSCYVIAAADGQPAHVVFGNLFTASVAGGLVSGILGGAIIVSSGIGWLFVVAFAAKIVALVTMCKISERGPDPADRLLNVARGGSFGSAFFVPLRSMQFRVLHLSLAALYFGTSVGMALMPNYLHERVGLDLWMVAISGSVTAVVSIAGTMTLGRLAVRLGALRCLLIAQAVAVSCCALALLAPSLGRWSLPFGIIGFGSRGILTVQSSLSRSLVTYMLGKQTAGAGYALQSTLLQSVNVVSAMIAGHLYMIDPAMPIAMSILIGLVAIACLASSSDPSRALTGGRP